MSEKPKVLLSTYTFFPDLNPRAHRWTALVDELSKKYEVHVVTRFSIAEKQNVKVFGQTQAVDSNRVRTHQDGIKSVFVRTVRKLLKLVVWPDYAARWIPFALKTIYQLQKKNDYKFVISSSHPISGHVPVYILKKMGRLDSLVWFVDIGDPFSLIETHDLNNQWLYKKFNYFFEKDVCRLAQKVFVTTKATLDLYKTGFGLDDNQIEVALPVVSQSMIRLNTNSLSTPVLDKTKINFIFAGTLYKKIRNPEVVLQWAGELQKKFPNQYLIHFFGGVGDCGDSFIDSPANVLLHGLVPHDHLRQILFNCSGIINIGNESRHQLPSKIVESVATGKFIFNFSLDPSVDTSTEYLKAYLGHTIIKDSEDFTAALDKFNDFKGRDLDLMNSAGPIVQKHLASEVVKKFDPQLLDPNRKD